MWRVNSPTDRSPSTLTFWYTSFALGPSLAPGGGSSGTAGCAAFCAATMRGLSTCTMPVPR